MNRHFSTLLLACWLWALALGSNTGWHAWAHGDEAEHADHECAVTLLAAGGCGVPDAVPLVVAAPLAVLVGSVEIRAAEVVTPSLGLEALKRGPPAAAV